MSIHRSNNVTPLFKKSVSVYGRLVRGSLLEAEGNRRYDIISNSLTNLDLGSVGCNFGVVRHLDD